MERFFSKVKEDISKILARADITELTQWLSLFKDKKKGCFYTVLGTCQKTFVASCILKIIHEMFG